MLFSYTNVLENKVNPAAQMGDFSYQIDLLFKESKLGFFKFVIFNSPYCKLFCITVYSFKFLYCGYRNEICLSAF